MSVLSWGKPTIIVKSEEDGAIYRATPTPVVDTTNLDTTEGETKEAKKEGGEVVDVRNDKSAYALTYEIYAEKGQKKPFADRDGVVLKNYSVYVVPEDESCIGIAMKKSKVSVKNTFTGADGAKYLITHKALANEDGTSQCQFGYLTVTKDSSGKITDVAIEEVEAESDVEA